MKTSSVNSPAPPAVSALEAAIERMYHEIEAHAIEFAERRGELLDMQAEAESAGRPFYAACAEELELVNKTIKSDDEQELLLVALADGIMPTTALAR